MDKNSILLLKTLLLSTSSVNILKYSRNKKKRNKIIGGFVGMFFLYAMIMSYSILMCIGYGVLGIIDSAPVMCALIISALAFMLTIFKTNGYLFNFKEYDMLMSLPFETSTVAACKFLYMYIKSLPWYLSISFAMMIGYGIFAKPAFYIYPIWILLAFFVPVIPMLFASFLGFLIAKISSGFKKTNLVQTVLTFVFVIFCFSLRYIIEAVFKNGQVEATLEKTAEITENAGRIYMPAGWFSDAVTKRSVPGILLLVGVTAALFLIIFRIVGKSYRNINSAMKSHAAAKKYKMTSQKKKSILNTIAFKEFRRLTGSTTYTVQGAMGEILAILLGLVTLVIGFDRIIAIVTQGAPLDPAMLQPAIPFIVYFFIGMIATTAISPSIEGKNYWIVQSLPIPKESLYQGKMLFNMYLTVPFMLLSTLCMCISAKVPLIDTILYLILGFTLCCFSTAWGCACGIKHMRLDWENEIEVCKQGSAVAIYMLPNMFVVMGLTVLVVFLGTKMNHVLLTLIFIAIAALLSILSYLRAMNLARKTF